MSCQVGWLDDERTSRLSDVRDAKAVAEVGRRAFFMGLEML
jgi:hypothetical protein